MGRVGLLARLGAFRAGIAKVHGCSVWSLDSDFERMSRLGFVTLHHLD
jgi:hypothetical protein